MNAHRIGCLLAVLFAACSPEPDPTLHSTQEPLTLCAPPSTLEGVDVSDAQGRIDWYAVRSDGVVFAVMKATQGTYNTQTTFAANWSGARAAGVARAPYHFFDPTEDGVAQANHFLSIIGALQSDDLPPMLDLECPDGDGACLGWPGASGWAPGTAIRQRVIDWIQTVRDATGREPVIYTSSAYFASNGIDATAFDGNPLWIAYPDPGGCFVVPAPWSSAAIWQYDWHGRVAGITGVVDRDRFLGTLDDLTAFAGGGILTLSPPAGANCHGLSDGLYCGNDRLGGDANTLYRCSGYAATIEQVCDAGCQTNPDPQNDECSVASWGGPNCAGLSDGLYCGTDRLGGDANTLYRCSGHVAIIEQVCDAGCQTNPDPQNDECAASSSSGPDCSGLSDALYCGSDRIGGDANTLYRCSGHVAIVEQVCDAGCQINPDPQNDACFPPAAMADCTGLNDALYCGSDYVHGAPDTLYRCHAGVATVEQHCAGGCRINPDGADDACW